MKQAQCAVCLFGSDKMSDTNLSTGVKRYSGSTPVESMEKLSRACSNCNNSCNICCPGPPGPQGPAGGFLFPVMNFNPEDGVLTISGLEQEISRVRYDYATAELIIRLAN